MILTTIILFLSTFILGVIFFGFFWWAAKDGQFENVEEAKFEMLQDDDSVDEEQR